MAVTTVTDANFEQEVLAADRPFLLDFWAEWCAPCKAIAPVLDQLSAEQAAALRVGKSDIQANPALAQRFGVMSIPMLILFKGGRPVMQLNGANDARDTASLMAKLGPHLS